MKTLKSEEAITILEDMKVNISIPKAAVTQIKRNAALNMAIDALLRCSEIPNDSDTISRQAAIDALDCINGTEEVLRSLPSAQPERETGRWMPDNRPGGGFWVCSNCKFPSEAFAANMLYKFCPNCGAKMLKDGEA